MASGLAVLAMWAGSAAGQVDTLRVVVNKDNANSGTALSSFGYDPTTDTMYTTSFGASGKVRRISNVGGAQVVTTMVSEAQIQLYYRDGDGDRGVSNPTQSGLVLNPLPVGAAPAYSFGVISDIANTRFPASSDVDSSVTKRLYRYNLQQPPSGGDGRDVFTTLMTLGQTAALSGNPTSTTSDFGRQGAFSLDGQSFYSIDGSTSNGIGGLYKTDLATGTTTKVMTSPDINTEPAVVANPGGGERILFRGMAATGNAGGVSYVVNNGATTGAPQVLLSAATLNSFFERTTGASDVRAMSTDAAGNVYMFDTTSGSLLRLDPQGRLSKVLTKNERFAFRDQRGNTDNVNTNIIRQQPRTVTHATAGQVTEVLYMESSPQSFVAGVYAFAPGDFDRDGLLTATDVALFKPALKTRGTTQALAGGFKFDMNGPTTSTQLTTTVVDWKDVKLVQPFFDFGDGDVDINGIVDFTDFQILQNNFGTTGVNTWLQGDLDGDNDVDFTDFQYLQNSFGYESSVLTGATAAAFDKGAWDAFVASAVPEPGALGVVGIGALAALGRRRRA
ncbi:MAG TPA: PEP-CTERM sorting domain-containing protein [Tepidisphaeraceae bacterium]|nr:PEP-CTERM sorting domain-containing protein [Tepidisphaeraceae bacterium]